MRNGPTLNRIFASIPTSGIRRIVDLAEARRAEGLPVYAFHLGEPSFDTPEAIKQATIQALMDGKVHYAPNGGLPQLRQAIAGELGRRFSTRLSPASTIVTIGACEALTLAIMGILEPGDELLVPTPCWPNYLQLPAIVGARAVQVPSSPAEGFQVRADRLEASITPRTRGILLTTPNNPTGAMLSRATWTDVLELARSRGLWVVSDEIYQDIVFPGHHHVGLLDVAREDDHWILLGGFSKSYAMTGWRLGYLVSHPAHTRELLKLHQNLVTSATTFTQWGALAAFSLGEELFLEMRQGYVQRRGLVLDALHRSGFEFFTPEGAFYVFARVPDLEETGESFCERVLRQHGLAFVPGNVFGENFTSWFRLCFAGPLEEVTAGMAQLSAAFEPSRPAAPR